MGCHSEPLQLQYYPTGGKIHVKCTDQDCIRDLRLVLAQQERGSWVNNEVEAHIASKHPSELPPYFVAAAPSMSPIMTSHGCWIEKKHLAVPGDGAVDSRCRYIGLKKTLEFVPHPEGKHSKHAGSGKKMGLRDGTTKDCWIMIQYHNMREEGLKLFVEEEMTLCKVYNGKHVDAPSINSKAAKNTIHMGSEYSSTIPASERESLENLERELNSSDSEEQLSHSQEKRQMELYKGLRKALEPPVQPPAGGGSRVWEHFSKIYQNDLHLAYAVCYHCGGMLKANSKGNGTSTLWRHPCTVRATQGQACVSH